METLDWGAQAPTIMFVGGVPSLEDLRSGRILTGTDGALLRKVMAGLDIDLSNAVGYTSVFMDRSQGAKPKIDAVRKVTADLINRLNRAAPKVVVALGETAVTALTGQSGAINKRRGFPYELGDLVVLPSRHPKDIITGPDGFPDLCTDLERALSIIKGEPHTEEPPYENYHIVDTPDKFWELITNLRENISLPLSVDLETTSLYPSQGNILSMGISWRRYEAHIIDCQWLNSVNPYYLEELKEVMADMECIFHNAQFDVLWLRSRNFNINLMFDTMLAHYTLDGRQDGHSLKRLAADRYHAPAYDDKIDARGFTLEKWEQPEFRRAVMMYNGADADYTLRLAYDLYKEMEVDGMVNIHDDILIPASIHFIRLRENGMLVDKKYHDALGEKWRIEIEDLEKQLKKFPGAENMNLRSTKQVKEYLYDTLALKPMGGKKNAPCSTKLVARETIGIQDDEAQEFWRTSQVQRDLKSSSTGTYMLYWLAQQHAFPRLLVRHRILSKLRGTYYEGYKELMDDQDRIRPEYKLHGTRTGRISSTRPNIHGMPRRKEIKRIFKANEGYIIVSADYSQAEIRMVAHLADDETLIAALDAQDIHREISKKMFNMTDAIVDALSAEEREIKRRAAKTIAFGLIYGRGAASIAPQLGVSMDEAKDYMAKFFKMMPKVATWLTKQKVKAKRDHEVVSLYGRKRRFPLIASKSHLAEVQRQAGNMPVQSSVSDMTLLANMRIIANLENRGIPCVIMPHVHDGFYFQVPEQHEELAVRITKEEMHAVGFETKVAFKCEIQTGSNWGELKVVYEG